MCTESGYSTPMFTDNYPKQNMSRIMRKQTFCICENKDVDQLRSNRKADQRLCFRYTDSTIPLLPISSLVCIGPGRTPECWFSHDAAQCQISVCAHLYFDIFLPVFFSHHPGYFFCLLGHPVHFVCPYHCPDYLFSKNLPAPPLPIKIKWSLP